MDIQDLVSHQRVKHIVDLYQLDGSDQKDFRESLLSLLEIYPSSLVELAMVEAIVKGWLVIPMPKGLPVIETVRQQLQSWQADPSLDTQPAIETLLTPAQFEQITGLDASLVFDAAGQVLAQRPLVPCQGAQEAL